MAKNTAITINGLDEAVRAVEALPAQITRAGRNALNVMLTESHREITDITHREVGLKKTEIRRRLKIERPKFISGQVVLSGQITASNARIPLAEYKIQTVRKSPTRAAVYVRDQIGRGERLAGSAFVNPRFSRTPYRRITRSGKRVPRGPIVVAAGPSMAAHLLAIATPQYISKRSNRLREIFLEKLDDQLSK